MTTLLDCRVSWFTIAWTGGYLASTTLNHYDSMILFAAFGLCGLLGVCAASMADARADAKARSNAP